MKSLFVSVAGQDDNIGDSVLRRGMLQGVRHPDIQLHVYVGNASADYVSGLGLLQRDVVYQNRAAWLASVRLDRGRGNTSFLANAGEIVSFGGPRFFGSRQLVALASVRVRGGALLQTGAGIRDVTKPQRLAKYSALQKFDYVTWRDQASRDYANVGEVAPDWGFATGLPESPSRLDEAPARELLAVTLRGDRAEPDDRWWAAVRRVAAELDVRIVVIVQVRRDAERAAALARRFGDVELIGWESGGHDAQEIIVRNVFRRSVGVVSDRLHALIIGATEGAYPLGLPPQSSAKLSRTLAPANLKYYLADIDSAGSRSVLDPIQLGRSVQESVASARTSLEAVGARARDLVLGR